MIRNGLVWLALAAALSAGCGASALPRLCQAPTDPVVNGLPPPGWAEPPEGEVARVDVRGLRSVPESLVRSVLHARAGAPIDMAVVRQDLVRILGLEVFEDVRASTEREDGRLVLVYEVLERPLVGRVVVRGPGKEVRSARTLSEVHGQVYDPVRLSRVAAGIVAEHNREGYLDARADVHARRGRDGRVDVCFLVEPGVRHVIDAIELVGNERISDEDLLGQIQTYGDRVNVAGGLYRQDLMAEDVARITALYYDRGMINVHVGEPEVRWTDGRLRIRIAIEEGPVFHVGRLSVSGDLAGPLSAYEAELQIQPGEVFSRARMLDAINRIHALDRRLGREWVDVEPRTVIDGDRRVIDLELVLGGPAEPVEDEPAPADAGAPAGEAQSMRLGGGAPSDAPAPDGTDSSLLDEQLQVDLSDLRMPAPGGSDAGAAP